MNSLHISVQSLFVFPKVVEFLFFSFPFTYALYSSDDTEPVFLTVDACSAIFLQGTDSSHITEMLGRKRCALWLNSHGGQVSRKERERCLLVIDVSNSTSNPAAKPCDNRDNPVLSAGRCQRQGPRVNCAHFVYNREWRQAEAKACFTHTASQDKQALNCVWVISSVFIVLVLSESQESSKGSEARLSSYCALTRDACQSEVISPRSRSSGNAGNSQHLEEKPPAQQFSGPLVDFNTYKMLLQCFCSQHGCNK